MSYLNEEGLNLLMRKVKSNSSGSGSGSSSGSSGDTPIIDDSNIGTLDLLLTKNKTSIVSAINEIYNGLYHKTVSATDIDNPNSWHDLPALNLNNVHLYATNFISTDTNDFIAGTNTGIIHSDGNNLFNMKHSNIDSGDYDTFTEYSDMLFAGSTLLAHANKIICSKDAGNTWSIIESIPVCRVNLFYYNKSRKLILISITYHDDDGDELHSVYYSFDGITWNMPIDELNAEVTEVIEDNSDPYNNIIFLRDIEGHEFEAVLRQDGIVYAPFTPNLSEISNYYSEGYRIVAYSSSYTIVGSKQSAKKLFYSVDNGETWSILYLDNEPADENIINVKVRAITYTDSSVYIATNKGVYRFDKFEQRVTLVRVTNSMATDSFVYYAREIDVLFYSDSIVGIKYSIDQGATWVDTDITSDCYKYYKLIKTEELNTQSEDRYTINTNYFILAGNGNSLIAYHPASSYTDKWTTLFAPSTTAIKDFFVTKNNMVIALPIRKFYINTANTEIIPKWKIIN